MFLDLTMILYHYTNLPAGVKIMQEGFLKVSNKIQNPELWFSKHQIFEPTALKCAAVAISLGEFAIVYFAPTTTSIVPASSVVFSSKARPTTNFQL